ncbi:hypothetical protein CVT26_009049 [Gymnopilus dilepis]|uniref:NACHT domain-containing protein n=1 Tax=Gymnopilus dilepis TaxID=231916 RepID=A0A409YR68_9AGAR|nr:hypothetical protein CVT26_009049 [Gymnopilus dilepis]
MGSLPTVRSRTSGEGDLYTAQIDHSIVGGRGNINSVQIINNGNRPPGIDGFQVLYENISRDAMHNSGEVSDQPKCHPGTREAIMKYLLQWASDLKSFCPIEWMHGPAGAGKSTILRTLAELLYQRGLLLGSFFFFRASENRNRSTYIISTLAYQLAIQIPEAKPHIARAIEQNPNIFNLSLRDQALALIVSPLVSVFYDPSFDSRRYPRVLVIDGLDECNNTAKQCQVLDLLLFIIRSVPFSLSVIIASRPEHHIRRAFDFGDLNRFSSRVRLDSSYKPDDDIGGYLRASFGAERRARPHDFPACGVWPSKEIIDDLVAKASGQFIYASTVIKFVGSPAHCPTERLDIVMGAIRAGSQRPFEQLDLLYGVIFEGIHADSLDGALRVLGLLLVPNLELPSKSVRGLSNTRSPNYIEHFLGLRHGDVRRFFYGMESLLTIGSDDENVQFFHASLSDYLFDSSRSGRFWIDCGGVYNDVLKICLSRLQSWPSLAYVIVEYSNIFFSMTKPDEELESLLEDVDFKSIFVDFTFEQDSRLDLKGWIGLLHWEGLVREGYAALCVCPAILHMALAVLPPENFRKKLGQFQPVIEPMLYSLLESMVWKTSSSGDALDVYQFPAGERQFRYTRSVGLSDVPDSAPFRWYLEYLLGDTDSFSFRDQARFADIASHLLRNLSIMRHDFVNRHQLALDAEPGLDLTFVASVIRFLLSKSYFHSELLRQCELHYQDYKANIAHQRLSTPNAQAMNGMLSAMEAYISVRLLVYFTSTEFRK